jgi:catechol-2,3-dioxygenase
MRNFYIDVLGFELLSQTDGAFENKAGESVLEIQKYHHKEMPFYHFAMNIPTN